MYLCVRCTLLSTRTQKHQILCARAFYSRAISIVASQNVIFLISDNRFNLIYEFDSIFSGRVLRRYGAGQ